MPELKEWKEIIIALIGIGGILIGWFLNLTSEMVKSRSKKKSDVSYAITNILEMYRKHGYLCICMMKHLKD